MSGLSSLSLHRRALAFALFALVFLLVTWANYVGPASQYRGMANQDFMSLWTGGKAIVLGLNPYSEAVWRPLRAAYGSTWLRDRIAPFPLWTFLFFVPFSFLTTRAAGALWMTLCQLSLVLGIPLLTRSLGWRGRSSLFLVLGAVLFRPTFPAIANGQLAPVLFLVLVLTYALYRGGHPFTAGLLLSLQLTKPNLALFLLLTAGWVFLVRRDRRSLAGLMTGSLSLLIVSWVILPGWPFQWLGAAEKSGVARANPTVWGLAYDWGGERWWPATAIGVGSLLYLALLVFLWKAREEDPLLGLSLAVVAATFFPPYLWAYEQIVLLFPTIVALRWGLASGWGPRWAWWGGWWLVTVGLGWTLFFIALRREMDTGSALMPLAALAYLVLAWRSLRRENKGLDLSPRKVQP